MAKVIYEYGAMSSSKTANALMTRFNYLERGRIVWLLKPSIDNRDGEEIVSSRIGLSANAEIIHENDNIEELMMKRDGDIEFFDAELKPDVIIVDECQFFTPEQIDQLKNIATYHDVPVLCFGLRTDFQSNLFPGSKRLMEVADSITEIKSICRCGEKAIINARIDENGNVITSGKQIDIGGNDKYEGMCWKCWKDKIKNADSTEPTTIAV